MDFRSLWNEKTRAEKSILIFLVFALLFILWRIWLPWIAEFQYRVGYGYLIQQDFPNGIKAYEKAVHAQPLETQYQIELGKAYEDFSRQQTDLLKRYQFIQKAEEEYQRMLRINPENPWYQHRIAEIDNLWAQFYSQAVVVQGGDGLKVIPRNQVLEKAVLAETDQKVKKYLKDAESKMFLAADLDPNNPLFKMAIAYLYHQRGDYSRALDLYQKVIKIDDRFAEAYYNQADIFRQQKRFDLAMQNYQAIEKFNPAFNNLHLMQAQLLFQQGKKKEGVEQLIQELKNNRDNVNAHQMLGNILYEEKKYADAAGFLRRATELQPQQPQSHYYLGVCYVQLAQYALAAQSFQKVLELVPGNIEAKNALQYVKTKL